MKANDVRGECLLAVSLGAGTEHRDTENNPRVIRLLASRFGRNLNV